MNFQYKNKIQAKNLSGLAFVIFLHVLIVYALLTGLNHRSGDVKMQSDMTIVPPTLKVTPPETIPVVKMPDPAFQLPYIDPQEVLPVQQTDANVPKYTTVQPDGHQQYTDGDDVVSVTDVRVAAVVDARACDKPDYPSAAIRDGLEGITTLQFLIGVDGHVVSAKIDGSSGFRVLDSAALSGLSRCKFKAGTVNGKPEQSWTKIQYVWKLD